MTEEQWLACEVPAALVGVVCQGLSDRKARLLVGACCRPLLFLFPGFVQRNLEASEAFADGALTPYEFWSIAHEADQFARRVIRDEWEARRPGEHAAQAIKPLFRQGWWVRERARSAVCSAHLASQASLQWTEGGLTRPALAPAVREVIGNPFRPAAALHDSLLTANDNAVTQLVPFVAHTEHQPPVDRGRHPAHSARRTRYCLHRCGDRGEQPSRTTLLPVVAEILFS
jgi:hypothetical protein